MNRTFSITSFVLQLAAAALLTGCPKKDDAPPPLPSAAPATEATAPTLALAELPPEVPSAVPSGKHGTGTARPGGNLSACCAALNQNAANAPEPTATYLKQAAATCGAMAAQGKDTGSAVGMLSGLLRGAGMPAACK